MYSTDPLQDIFKLGVMILILCILGIIPRFFVWLEWRRAQKDYERCCLMDGMPEDSETDRLDKFYDELKRLHKAYYSDLDFGELLKEVFDTYADISRTGSLAISNERVLKHLLEYAKEDDRLPEKSVYDAVYHPFI